MNEKKDASEVSVPILLKHDAHQSLIVGRVVSREGKLCCEFLETVKMSAENAFDIFGSAGMVVLETEREETEHPEFFIRKGRIVSFGLSDPAAAQEKQATKSWRERKREFLRSLSAGQRRALSFALLATVPVWAVPLILIWGMNLLAEVIEHVMLRTDDAGFENDGRGKVPGRNPGPHLGRSPASSIDRPWGPPPNPLGPPPKPLPEGERIPAKLESVPTPMLIFCPQCWEQHIDEVEPMKGCPWCGQLVPESDPCDPPADTCSHTRERWTNPPHRSHQCEHCGWVWRISDYPTRGVATLLTAGSRDQSAVPSLRKRREERERSDKA